MTSSLGFSRTALTPAAWRPIARTSLSLNRMARPSFVPMMMSLLARGQLGREQLALRLDGHGQDAALADVLELAEARLLDQAVGRQHDDVLVLAEFLDGEDRADAARPGANSMRLAMALPRPAGPTSGISRALSQ